MYISRMTSTKLSPFAINPTSAAEFDAETFRRRAMMRAQLNRHPSIKKLGSVEFVELGGCKTLMFVSGEYQHCINADFRGFESTGYEWAVLMVTRRGAGKKFHQVDQLDSDTLSEEGIKLITSHVKRGLTKFRKITARSIAA